MNQKEEKGSSGPKPRYVWDPKKLAWVETTEAETEEAVPEKAAVESTREAVVEEVTAGAKEEEGSAEVPVEAAPVEVLVEAVEAVGPQYRGAWSRLGAFIVDGAILLLVTWLVGKATGGGIALNSAVETGEGTSASYWWVMPVILLLYFVGFWTWRGQTPGKMLFKARVVKKNGSRMGIVRAFLRFVILFVYLLVWALTGGSIIVLVIILLVLLLIIGLSKKKRGLHDIIAGTVVVSTRSEGPQPVEYEPSVTSEPETDKQE